MRRRVMLPHLLLIAITIVLVVGLSWPRIIVSRGPSVRVPRHVSVRLVSGETTSLGLGDAVVGGVRIGGARSGVSLGAETAVRRIMDVFELVSLERPSSLSRWVQWLFLLHLVCVRSLGGGV